MLDGIADQVGQDHVEKQGVDLKDHIFRALICDLQVFVFNKILIDLEVLVNGILHLHFFRFRKLVVLYLGEQ